MHTIKRLLGRHTTAVAYLALFAALGGSAYAAATITGAQIKDGTVTGKDVKNGSLGAGKLAATAVSSLEGQPGPAGPQGPKGDQGPAGETGPAGPVGPRGATGATGAKGDQGPQGIQGVPGANGVSGWVMVQSDGIGVGGNGTNYAEAKCPDNTKILGGGGSATSIGLKLTTSGPSETAGKYSWVAEYVNTTSTSGTIFAWAICAAVS